MKATHAHWSRACLAGLMLVFVRVSWAFWPPTGETLPNFDRREVVSADRVAEIHTNAVSRMRSFVSDLRVDFDERTGTLKWIVSERGFLTGPRGRGRGVSVRAADGFVPNEPHLPTKAFLKEHESLFGHGPEILEKARVKREFITPHNGLQTVVWEQSLDGIPVFDGLLVSHTTANGELVSLSSHFVPHPAEAAQAAVPSRAVAQTNPPISAKQAVALAARNLGETLDASEVTETGPSAAGAELRQRFSARGLNGETQVRLVWLPMNRQAMRLTWEVVLTSRARGEMYRVLIDALAGEALLRHRLTEYLSDASFRVYPGDSPSPFSPGCPSPCNTQPPMVARTLMTFSALDTNASPNGWIDDGVNETRGNNVFAHTDRNFDDVPDLPRPQGVPFRVFDFPLDLAQSPTNYASAAVTELFYWCNWMHDQLYALGFTEAAGNFQMTNFNRGGQEGDSVQADAQDGSGFNNANMATPTDGFAPRLQMFLFNGPTPDRDGGFDHEVVLHEYTHGLSNRRVGGGVGMSELQSRGLGEGWSDWYALALLSEPGDDANGVFAKGAYVTYLLNGMTQNYYFGIRRYPYSMDLTKNPLTFKDIDVTQADDHPGVLRSPIIGNVAEEVHNQGEVWCVTLWEARANLIAKYGHVIGNRLILQLVTDGMNLSPANPNFLQARDAILQADLVNNGGANLGELWAAFAKRGMGYSAASPPSTATTGVIEAFDVPDNLIVTPAGGFTSTGPVGGPFHPVAKSFTLVNIGASPLDWAASATELWLDLVPLSAVLVPGTTNSLNVSLNAAAGNLVAGSYTNFVWVTNVNTGAVQARGFILRVGLPDHFTELFDAADNDVDFQTLTFTPDGSANFYSVCREPAAAFPTDPVGGVNLALGSHTHLQLTIPTNISIYGRSTNVLFLNSEGQLTLGSPDASGEFSLANHFSQVRVSGLAAHLHPGENGGSVSWLQMEDRVAITFSNAWEFSSGNYNNFQFELFHDGRIRLTHLALGTPNGLVGLSRGTGIPTGFLESDLSNYGSCVRPLRVNFAESATEGDGSLLGQVSILSPVVTNLPINLVVSDPSEVGVPLQVVILAGETNASFELTILDDLDLDGSQNVIITASALGYAVATDLIHLADNESAELELSLLADVTEGSGQIQGMVHASAAPTEHIPISLVSSDPTEIQVPLSVILSAGQTSAVFSATIINDTLIDGDQVAAITAQVPNWTTGITNVTVHDDESTALVVILPMAIREGSVSPALGSVRISGSLPTNVVVNLMADDATELVLPATVSILSGQTSVDFEVTAVNDAEIDGAQNVLVTASANGFTAGSTGLNVNDDEIPPIPTSPQPVHLATNVLPTVDLAWQSSAATGEIITNDVYLGTNPVPGPPEFLGSTTSTHWALPDLSPLTTYYWQVVARKSVPVPGPIWQFTVQPPIVGIGNVVLYEADAGIGNATFTVTVWPPPVWPVSVVFTTTGATAIADQDFLSTNGVLVFGPGETNQTIKVEIIGDTFHELNESFTATLSGATNATLSVSQGVGTILNDDPLPILSIGDVSLSEGNLGATSAVFSVSLSAASGLDVVVIYNTSEGNAQDGSDYMGVTGELMIPAGGTTSSITVPVNGDLQIESDEVFYVDLDSVSGAFLLKREGVGLIVNDDGLPGEVDRFVWSVLDGVQQVGQPFGVNLAALDAFDNPATNFNGVAQLGAFVPGATTNLIALTLTESGFFSNGVWSGSLAVLVPATNLVLRADDENGHSGISTPLMVELRNDLAVTVKDLPDPVALGGSITYQIVVTNVGPAVATGVWLANWLPASVRLVAASHSHGNSFTNGSLFVCYLGTLAADAAASIMLEVQTTVAGPITNHATVYRAEADALPGNNSALTITSVQMPALAVNNVSLREGTDGAMGMVFSVSLSLPAVTNVLVDFVTADDTALAGSDYFATNGTLNFAPGELNKSVVVQVLGDSASEPNEAFLLVLTNAVNAVIGTATGSGTILRDESTGIVAYYTDGAATATGWTAPVAQAGFVPLRITNIATFALTNLDILIIDEGNNTTVSRALAGRLAEIATWVSGGGKLVIHDRSAGSFSTNAFLLGTSGITTVRLTTPDLDVIPPGANLIVLGPHGPISDSTLDGGNSSAHGYVPLAQLPSGAEPILAGGGLTNVACFSYPLGAGLIYYSTIPLDCYLSGGSCEDSRIAAAVRSIYAPNVLAYMASYSSGSGLPPRIVNQPANQTMVTDGMVTFRVAVVGSAPLEFQWRKDAVVVAGATNAVHFIVGAQTNDTGNYDVVIANQHGAITSSVAALTVMEPPAEAEFRILALSANNSRVVEHDGLTGDDRGGIAASKARVLYTGDFSTARFALADLSGGATLGRVYDALVGDLRSGKIYSLGNGGTPLTAAGGTVTTLLEHDGITGQTNGNSLTLSTPINLPGIGEQVGIFAGFGRVVLHSGSRAYDIAVPSGVVVDLGPMAFVPHYYSENWAYWGVAEFFNGTVHLVCVRDSQTIARTAVPAGPTTTLASFSNLSDMAALTVSVFNNRWYFHHEGPSQFGGGSETVGYADAVFSITPAPLPSIIPLKFQSLEAMNDGQLEIILGTADGSPLTAERAAGIQFSSATNLSFAPGNWVPANISAVFTNGMLRIQGLNWTNNPLRFFRAEEAP